jgi:hypothetical protein
VDPDPAAEVLRGGLVRRVVVLEGVERGQVTRAGESIDLDDDPPGRLGDEGRVGIRPIRRPRDVVEGAVDRPRAQERRGREQAVVALAPAQRAVDGDDRLRPGRLVVQRGLPS